MLKDPETRDDWTIRMEHGAPLRFGSDGSKAVVRSADGSLAIEEDVAPDDPRVVVHDAHCDNSAYAFALSRLQAVDSRYAPMGVFRSVEHATYNQRMSEQLTVASATSSGDDAELQALLRGSDTWQI